MQIPETGVYPISERYFFTPSSLARDLFYYPTRCGHYYCNHKYLFTHQSEIARQGDHNQNIMLLAVQDGAFELDFSEGKTIATRGQIVLFDCQEPYGYKGSDGLEFFWLLFNGLNTRQFYQRILRTHGGKRVLTLPNFVEIVQLLDSFHSRCACGERMSEAACSQLIHRLLCLMLLDDGDNIRNEDDRIAQAIRFMNHHLFEQIGVNQVAGAVNLSPSHFSRQFKSRTGYSPYEYIVLRRIDQAKHMLMSTQLSIKEIAFQTGYNSEENFIHSFQKNVGISPGMFRKYPI